jgi:hypothetical protein
VQAAEIGERPVALRRAWQCLDLGQRLDREGAVLRDRPAGAGRAHRHQRQHLGRVDRSLGFEVQLARMLGRANAFGVALDRAGRLREL